MTQLPLAPQDHHGILCWLVPENDAARSIVSDEINSRFRDAIPVVSTPSSISPILDATVEGTIECLRIPFHLDWSRGALVSFGRNPDRADILLKGSYYSRFQALLDIDPNSLELTCADYSTFHNTSLLYDDDSGPVGRWHSLDANIMEQAILPSSNAVLEIYDAQFTFRWYSPSQEDEIKAAKIAFIQREVDIREQRTPIYDELQVNYFNTEYPTQYTYHPDIDALALLKLPIQIRYMIFRLLLCHDSIIFDTGYNRTAEAQRRFRTVRGCIFLLNCSYQLLNPQYSSRELATEAAEVFYGQNIFQVNILNLTTFIWTLKHMPFLGFLDPTSAISRLRLCLNCDRTTFGTIRGNKSWHLPTLEDGPGGADDALPIVEYVWSDDEKEELAQTCTSIMTRFPGVTVLEIHIRKQAMCSELQQPVPDAEPPLYILEKMNNLIKQLMGCGDKDVKVFLHGQRWKNPGPNELRAYRSEETTEDITGWWSPRTDEDETLLCEENIKWLEGMQWHSIQGKEDWERKGRIEAAVMRRRAAEWS